MSTAPRRVAYFLRAFPKLSETFILGEILALRRTGVDVRVFALEPVREPRRHPEAEALLPHVTFVPPGMVSFPPRVRRGGPARADMPPRDQRQCWRAGRWAAPLVARWGAQHIHAHFAGPAATMAAAAAERTGIPFSFTAHAKDIFSRHVPWPWVRELARRARAVVTVCDYNHEFLTQRLARARVVRIYNGVDLDQWRRARSRPAGPSILAVGRLVPKKGFHVLIEAMAILKEWDVPALATIVGEGVEREHLARAIRAHRLGRRVRLSGGLPHADVRRLMHRARVVVSPSVVEHDGNQDALPTVLLEAGACGKPAVATRVAGIPEIVRHGRTGILVPPGDAPALARALRRMLERPREAEAMGHAARARIERLFDQHRAVEQLAHVFAGREVAAARRDGRPGRSRAGRAVSMPSPVEAPALGAGEPAGPGAGALAGQGAPAGLKGTVPARPRTAARGLARRT